MNGEEDEELNTFAADIRREIEDKACLTTFSGLLKAKEYTLMLINDTQNEDSLIKADYYSNLSMFYNEGMKFDEGFIWAEKALQLQLSDLTMTAGIYVNMRISYLNKGNTKEATSYLHKAREIYIHIFSPNHQKLIEIYMNLNLAYYRENNFLKTMEYLPQIISSDQQSLSNENPILAVVYRIYGCIYHQQNNNDLPLKYLRKCLDIQERTLPKGHYT